MLNMLQKEEEESLAIHGPPMLNVKHAISQAFTIWLTLATNPILQKDVVSSDIDLQSNYKLTRRKSITGDSYSPSCK